MKRFFMRHRTLFLMIGALLALLGSALTDPDKGWSAVLASLGLLQGWWVLVAAHCSLKALLDYKEADKQSLFIRAAMDPVGAGLALVAMAIMFVGLLLVFAPRAHAAGLPAGFQVYRDTLLAEQARYWPNQSDHAALAGLVEQESCPSLTARSCWNPSARLKSAREEGAGVGQLTRAYRADGSLRFDALAELQEHYASDFAGLSWQNIYQRPDFQFRALVIMSRDAAKPFASSLDMLKFGDAAYNGGVAGVQMERRACHLAPGCNPNIWFANVERHCLKSREKIYGRRSACDINREHVQNVFGFRRQRYAGLI